MLVHETFNRVVCTKGKHPCFSPLPKNQLQGNDRQKPIRNLTETRTTTGTRFSQYLVVRAREPA